MDLRWKSRPAHGQPVRVSRVVCLLDRTWAAPASPGRVACPDGDLCLLPRPAESGSFHADLCQVAIAVTSAGRPCQAGASLRPCGVRLLRPHRAPAPPEADPHSYHRLPIVRAPIVQLLCAAYPVAVACKRTPSLRVGAASAYVQPAFADRQSPAAGSRCLLRLASACLLSPLSSAVCFELLRNVLGPTHRPDA